VGAPGKRIFRKASPRKFFMSKKRTSSKSKKSSIALPPDEARDLEMMVDRLQVQDPRGESLSHYLQSLRGALESRPTLAAALVERLSHGPTDVGYRVLDTLKDLVDTPAHRRRLKQAAYRFAQKGYKPEEDEKGWRQVVLIPREVREPAARCIPSPDLLWSILCLIPSLEQGSQWLVMSYLEEPGGRIRVHAAPSNGRQYRELLEKVESRFSVTTREIPATHAARLFFEAPSLAGDGSTDSGYEEAARLLRPFHDETVPPHIYALEAPPRSPEELLRSLKLEDLLEETSFRPLLVPQDVLEPRWRALEAEASSVLVVSSRLREERSRRSLERVTDEVVGSKRLYYLRFFEEEAMRLVFAGKNLEARRCLAAAAWLASGMNPGAAELFRDIVVYSISLYWPDGLKAEGEESQAPERFQRTESGLIVPR